MTHIAPRPKPRTRNRPRPLQSTPTRDLGPDIRIQRGDVVTEDRNDPQSSAGALVRGARVRDGLATMAKRGWISVHQWHAACRFRDDLDLAAGVRDGSRGEDAGVRSPFSGAHWPGDVQIDASRRCAAVWDAVGVYRAGVVIDVVLRAGTLQDYAARYRMGRQRASDMLIGALDAIEQAYGEMRAI